MLLLKIAVSRVFPQKNPIDKKPSTRLDTIQPRSGQEQKLPLLPGMSSLRESTLFSFGQFHEPGNEIPDRFIACICEGVHCPCRIGRGSRLLGTEVSLAHQ